MIDALPVRSDVLVLLLAAALYLIDLGKLLFTNEVLFIGRRSSNWSVTTPADGFFIGGRYAVFPRPFHPGTTVARLVWPSQPPGSSPDEGGLAESLEGQALLLRFPSILCTALLPQILLGIPIAYWALSSHLPLFFLLIAIYLQILTLVTWLFRARRRLAVSWPTALLLAFEALVCIPYAINLHRKLAEKMLARQDLEVLKTGRQLLQPEDQAALTEYLKDSIDSRPVVNAGSGKGSSALQALRQRLDREHLP